MSKVLQAKLKAQEASDGQFKFFTLQMGMPVPYRIYSEISQEEIVRDGEGWCKRNHPYIVQVQESRDYSGSSLCRSCTSVRKHPAKLSVSDFVGYLKGKSALIIFDKHPEMGNKWDRSFWARGYYVSTVGNVDEETVKEYIRRQTEESMNEDRKTYRPL